MKKLLCEFIEMQPALDSQPAHHVSEPEGQHGRQTSPLPTFNDYVERWKLSEGPALGETTFGHYSNALNAYVLPTWRDRHIETINREAIQKFLVEQATKYSRSSLKSMRLVIAMVMGWAERNGDIERPNGWLDNIRLPKKCAGRKVMRAVLTSSQVLTIMSHLEEPYATLVFFLGMLGRRIEEAIGIKPDDLDENDVLHIRRVIYRGRITELEEAEQQALPLGEEHMELIGRLRALGTGHKWVFHSLCGTPIDAGNARRRYLKPAAKAAGVQIGGWHDFRHTLAVNLRKSGVHPKFVAGVLGHKKVDLAPNVYDHCDTEDIRSALGLVGKRLLPKTVVLLPNPRHEGKQRQPTLKIKGLVSAEGIEPSTY